MPGIYGVVNRSHKLIAAEDIKRPLNHFKFYSHKDIRSGIFSGGVVYRNSSVQIVERDELLFVLYGDIYTISDVGFRGDIKELLDKYLKSGNKLFRELNGEFCIVIWNEEERVLTLVTDHLGTKPLYYYHDTDHTIVAPEVKAILNVLNERSVDKDGVREFLTFGYCLDDHTFIQSIKLALPGYVIELNTGVSKEEYWSIQDFIGGKKATKPFDELIKKHQELLDRAIDRRISRNKTYCVSLSGGLDSRTIVAFLDRQGHKKIKTTTFGVSGCLDEKYAKKVAQFLNLPNTFFELNPVEIKESFKKIVYLMDGMLSVKHIHDYPFLPEKYHEWDIHITGFFGDPIHGQRLFPTNPLDPDVSKAKSDKELLRLLVKKHSQYGLNGCKLLNEEDGQEKLLRTVKSIVERSQLTQPLQIYDYFDLYERQRRFIAQIFQLAGKVFDYKMPFTDKSLVEFCLRLPISYRKKQKLAKASFVDGFSELARISLQKTHTHLKAGKVRERISESVYYFQYVLKRFVEIVSKGRKSYRPSHIYDPYDEWSRKEFKSLIESILLDEKTLSRDFYNPTEIKRIVSKHMCGRKNYEEIIYLLFTFEMWYRLFIDKREKNSKHTETVKQ
jgi:asparagine synthase (glutamine-hydrolysing)